MATFTVSLLASIPISALVQIEADNEADAVKIANQMQTRAQLNWTYNGRPVPSYSGPVSNSWASTGVIVPPGPKKSTTVLDVSPTHLVFGTTITTTATIAPGATGTVSFYDGLILLGTATPDMFGVATLSGLTIPIGIQEIVAQFAGDLYFGPSTSNTVQVTVTAPPTTTVMTATPNPQTSGSPVIMMATVSSSESTPTGLVIFYDGPTQISAAALSGGTCSISYSSLSVGIHILTAAYQGDADFLPSTSPPVSEMIT